MSHHLILDALHGLKNAFTAAHPSKPTKSFLRAELARVSTLVEGLPDDDAPTPGAYQLLADGPQAQSLPALDRAVVDWAEGSGR